MPRKPHQTERIPLRDRCLYPRNYSPISPLQYLGDLARMMGQETNVHLVKVEKGSMFLSSLLIGRPSQRFVSASKL